MKAKKLKDDPQTLIALLNLYLANWLSKEKYKEIYPILKALDDFIDRKKKK